jgi:hypothetical protein
MVFTASLTGTITAIGIQQIDVVAANEVLRQADNRLVQTHFTVVIGCMLRHEAGKLSDLS